MASNASLFTQKLGKFRYLQAAFNQIQENLTKFTNSKEVIENAQTEIIEAIKNNKSAPIIENAKNNRRSLNLPIDHRALSRNDSILSNVSDLPPLIISKNPIKAPGLSYKSSNPAANKVKNFDKANIYVSKTVKRPSEDGNQSLPNIKKYEDDEDCCFSTQDLKDISHNEAMLTSVPAAKRAKY